MQPAYAGSVSNAKINSYIAANGNLFFFYTTVAETSKPACNSQSRFAVNTTIQSGKDIMEAVINAKNANLSVNVSGTGTCTISSTSENASYVTVFGTSAMVGPRGLTGPIGPIGPRGPAGQVVAKTFATCASANVEQSGVCSCANRTLSRQTSYTTCTVTSESGSCSAKGDESGFRYFGSCCVCG